MVELLLGTIIYTCFMKTWSFDICIQWFVKFFLLKVSWLYISFFKREVWWWNALVKKNYKGEITKFRVSLDPQNKITRVIKNFIFRTNSEYYSWWGTVSSKYIQYVKTWIISFWETPERYPTFVFEILFATSPLSLLYMIREH